MYQAKDQFLEERMYEDYNAELALIEYQQRQEFYQLASLYKIHKHYSKVKRPIKYKRVFKY